MFDASNEIHVDFCELYCALVVLEKRRYKPHDCVVGHVILGPENTNHEAIDHWNSSSDPTKLELPRWHGLLPAIVYNAEE